MKSSAVTSGWTRYVAGAEEALQRRALRQVQPRVLRQQVGRRVLDHVVEVLRVHLEALLRRGASRGAP